MNTKDVAVVILNYNGKNFLEQFLPAVCQFSGDAKIVVADNNSSDESIPFLEKQYSGKVDIIRISENLGFCGGYNYALKKIESKYYVLLNSDVEVTPNWLNPLLEVMEKHTNVAACQPKIKYYSDKSKFEYAGAAGGFMDKWGYPYCRGRLFETLESDNGQYDEEGEIFWATGCCMMVRSELYHRLGGLDDDFFAHMEEIDLCWRMLNRGYKIYYTPESEVFHVGGGTLSKESPRKTYFNFRNSLLVLLKNLPGSLLFPMIFWRMILDGVAGVKFLVEGKFGHFSAIFRAHLSFYTYIRRIWKKRNDKSSNKKLGYEQLSDFSVVYQYFAKGVRTFSALNKK
ncbi:glycosyltransferase family 2 protein [Sediminitomix flava]|uniref:Glycosyltransferase 2-like domain-containing protein n=1 Tax=Sediminitomix flava TaxID=379075 RepID=A0A316A4M3_SEDFL|nr:glycosyltransferase family 2 protein [Sediminitomix flava]PWJ44707.1 hypothetical protein BC781_1011078 [Sediminitomix flava]